MVEVDPTITLIGPHGPVTLLEVFEGRRQLIACYFMWHTGHPAPEQCEGRTWVTSQVRELSYNSFSRRHLRHRAEAILGWHRLFDVPACKI